MKTRATKILAVLSAAALLSASLSGCGEKPAAPEAASGGGSESASVKEPVKEEPAEIHIFNRINPEVMVENNPILAVIEDKFNVIIQYEAPPINNYAEKLQITLASGDLPDIFYDWGADSNYEQWAKDGLLAVLDDKIPNYPNIVKNVDSSLLETMRSVETGKIHSIPKTNTVNYFGFRINQQWLDNLKLKAPTTLEEFREVCRAFTFDDPDQNGKNDTYGLSGSGNTFVEFRALKSSFGLGNVKDADGTYKVLQRMSGYIPYLTFLREMYAEKTIDPEFFTNKYLVDYEKQRNNMVGIVECHQGNVLGELKYDNTALERYTYIAPMQNINSGKSTVYGIPPIWGTWMISADSQNIDKCLELIDYGNSEEGFTLMSMGIEGVDYNSYDLSTRMVDRTPEQAAKLATYSSSYFSFANAMNGEPAIIENGDTPERLEKYYKDFDAAKAVIDMVDVPTPKAPKLNTFNADNPDLVKKLSENEIKYVVGEIDQAQFEAFLNDTYFPAVSDAEAEYITWMENNATN